MARCMFRFKSVFTTFVLSYFVSLVELDMKIVMKAEDDSGNDLNDPDTDVDIEYDSEDEDDEEEGC